MMWHRDKRASSCSLLLLWLGVITQVAFGSPLQLQKRATPCDELIDIIDDYGTLKGTLGGAQIVMSLSGEAGTTIGQFMTLLNTATLNVWTLFDTAGCKRYQAPSGEDFIEERQVSTAVCSNLTKVSADVAKAVSLMATLVQAKGLPSQLYMDPLKEAVDDAKVKIVVIENALKTSSGC